LQWRSPPSLRSRRGRPPEFPRAIRLRRSHRFTGLTTRSCTSTPETAGFATAPKSPCVQLMECRARPAHRIFGPGNAYPHGMRHQIPNGVLTIVLGNAAVGESLSRANRSPIFPCPLVVLNESPGPRMPGLCGQLSAHFMRGCRRAPLVFIQGPLTVGVCAKLLTRHKKSWPGSDPGKDVFRKSRWSRSSGRRITILRQRWPSGTASASRRSALGASVSVLCRRTTSSACGSSRRRMRG
jgi:hypothetical protein